MIYDFDREVDRTDTYDLKWNRSLTEENLHAAVPTDFIPMWVADSDFACPSHVVEAIQTRAAKEIYGYCAPLPPFYDAVCWWQKRRYDWTIDSTWITALPTVIAGINISIRTLTNEGDGVIIQTPVYNPFATIISRTGRKVINNTLCCTNGRYEMDYDLLETQASDPSNKLLILCSPHNPVGRVWSEMELRRLADICISHDVTIVSDEIHSDIIMKGHKHYPLLTLDPQYAQQFIHLTSPSKTFNIPGLKISLAIIPNAELKKAFDNTQLAMSLDIKNTFGLEGVVSCYRPQSEPWLATELDYIQGNIDLVEQFLKDSLPQITMQRPEGTFLCWLNCTGLGLSDMELIEKVAVQAGVICVPGTWFGVGGEYHLRLNVGCTRSNLYKALERIAQVLS